MSDDADKEAEKLLPCLDSCDHDSVPHVDGHESECPAYFRPAVAAALRKRDEEIERLKAVQAAVINNDTSIGHEFYLAEEVMKIRAELAAAKAEWVELDNYMADRESHGVLQAVKNNAMLIASLRTELAAAKQEIELANIGRVNRDLIHQAQLDQLRAELAAAKQEIEAFKNCQGVCSHELEAGKLRAELAALKGKANP